MRKLPKELVLISKHNTRRFCIYKRDWKEITAFDYSLVKKIIFYLLLADSSHGNQALTLVLFDRSSSSVNIFVIKLSADHDLFRESVIKGSRVY